ncbi:ImuA family protein [Cognatishimia maritima]|uniref:Protein ImuA n=1 Tax=Cognatishimia maritima TaxID=870908 RepID=A0A1M5V936_9RHOB|nr:hypothetical protein [Cognatishimia maritima]SHH71721.1 protein ImuA [Cognatishimia maritima]
MSPPVLKRAHDRPAPQLTLAEGLSLRLGRLHEACGSARRSFALWLAARTEGPVFWVCPPWMPDQLNPNGVAEFADPSRFTLVAPRRAEDVLWALEEILVTGAVPLVVGDLSGFPALTPVRRLHLAAESGGASSGRAPLGLILTPDLGGAPGVESRWHMVPRLADHGRSWHLTRLRARTAPPKSWEVGFGSTGFTPKKEIATDLKPFR